MSNRIIFRSDNLVEILAPTNVRTGALISSGTVTARLFHDRRDTQISADEASGQTDLSIVDAQRWVANKDRAYVLLDTGAWFDAGLVTAVDVDTNTITVTNALSGASSKGRPVAKILGAEISMVAFGTPVAGEVDWGFYGTIADDHGDLEMGMPVRVEIEVDGGASLKLVDVVHARVTDGQ